MNKTELVNAIADKSGLSRADAGKALDALKEAVTEGLVNGDRITIIGFGSWSVENRGPRTGRNPRTGEAMDIPAKNVVKFKVGKTLSDAVN